MPKGAGNTPGQCGPETAKFPIDNTGNSVDGVIISGNFQNDHVFEAQTVSQFLEWLCNGDPIKYPLGGPIPFPTQAGFVQPNTEWCSDVFGEPDNESIDLAGWLFPSSARDNDPNNWIMNAAAELGGTDRTDLMALLYSGSNNAKGKILGAENVATGNKNSAGARMQGVVNVSPCPFLLLQINLLTSSRGFLSFPTSRIPRSSQSGPRPHRVLKECANSLTTTTGASLQSGLTGLSALG